MIKTKRFVKGFLLSVLLQVLLILSFSNVYAADYEESVVLDETETVCETSLAEIETDSRDETVEENIEKKRLTSDAVIEILGGDYWLLSEEQLHILDEAGYDVDEFYQIHEKQDMGVMLLSNPGNYTMTKLKDKANISWGTSTDDRLYMFGGNSYWNQGTYVQIYTLHRNGSYGGDYRDAYCLNPMCNDAPQGEVDAYEVMKDDLIKAFYYGFGGPGYNPEIANIYCRVDPYYSAFYHGSDEAYYVLTHSMAAMVYEDPNWAYGLSQSAADTVIALWEHIKQLPSPNAGSNVTFSQPEGTYTFLNSNNLYECPTIYVEGSPESYIEYEVPQGVTLHKGDGTTCVGGQKVKLYGGTSFCLTAPEDAVQGTYQATYRGKVMKYRALAALGNDLQDVGWMNRYVDDGTETMIQVDWPEEYTVKITLTKTICSKDINFDNGNPMFTFEIDGTERSGQKRTCYAILDFTEEYVNSHKDGNGNVSMSVVFDDLKPGDYIASELITSRYQQENITNIVNGATKENKVRFTLTSAKQKEGCAEFVNVNYEQQNYSDAQKVINHLYAK